MKSFFISLVAVFFTFFMGCQENSIYKVAISFYPEVIKLEGLIYDP